ncbi:pectinesterase 4 [Coffea arabica]|uniref:Pectinesterase n=1 Tax=Coffea arabica TaxID=13443 RepID=A0A6P6SE30_COFAR|nr:pectinesterase 4-like [Coffea arabica]
MMGGKVVVSVVSLILVVGVIIGAVAVVKHGEDSKNNNVAGSSMKSVTTFCESTNFKDACAKSVESVANNATASPKDYLMAALNATIQEVQKALQVANATGSKVDPKQDPYNHVAAQDCQELLGYAVDELQAAFSTVGDSELHTLNDRVDELLNWLSAVYSYQSDCLDEFDKPELRSAFQNGMLNATQLTDNAVSIVASLSDLLKGFNISLGNFLPPAGGRRLLQGNDVMGHEESFPQWFPAGDRRLLAAHRRGGVLPNAVVAKDGSGQFKTISQALAAYPANLQGRYVIYVKAGIYEENVIVDKKQANVFIYGDGANRTIVTGSKNFGIMHIQTSNTATFSALGDRFMARGMTFRNTAGPEGHQAVALRIMGDLAAVFDCKMEGFQDTLYYQTHRQFYRNCVISGTVDFIFGKGSAVIQNSVIIVRKGLPNQYNTVTADGKELEKDRTGLVLQNCQIVAEDALFPVRFQVANYLGRPWKKFAKTVIMQTEIGDLIRPQGYIEWQGETFEKTSEYLEFANRGPGAVAPRNKNFTRSRFIDGREASLYTVDIFIQGHRWLRAAGLPFTPGL